MTETVLPTVRIIRAIVSRFPPEGIHPRRGRPASTGRLEKSRRARVEPYKRCIVAHLRVIITRPAPLPRRHLLSWPPLGFLWGIRIPTIRSVGLSASSFATGLVITLAGSSDAVREFILK